MRRAIDFCEGILNVDEEYSTVHFVHNSIKLFLLAEFNGSTVNVYHVDEVAADKFMGEICVTYLNFNHLKGQLTKVETVDENAMILPQSIVRQALPRSIARKVATTLLKSESAAQVGVHAQLKKVAYSAIGKKPDAAFGHSFHAYSRDYWLLHTRHFTNESKVFSMWHDMVEGYMSTVPLPWAQGIYRAHMIPYHKWQWAVLNDHAAVLDLMFHLWDSRTRDLRTKMWRERDGMRHWAMGMKGQDHLWLSLSSGSSSASDASEAEAPAALPETSRSMFEELLARSKVNDNLISGGIVPGGLSFYPIPLTFLVKELHTLFTVSVTGVVPFGYRLKFQQGIFDLTWTIGVISGFNILESLLRIPEVDLGSTDGQGYTALARAVQTGNTEMVKLLFKAQDDRPHAQYPAWRSYEGDTLLMTAVLPGHTEILQIILERQPFTVNWQRDSGETALSIAIQLGRVAMVAMLLGCPDLDTRLTDWEGRSPWNWAQKMVGEFDSHRMQQIVALLKEYYDSKGIDTSTLHWYPTFDTLDDDSSSRCVSRLGYVDEMNLSD